MNPNPQIFGRLAGLLLGFAASIWVALAVAAEDYSSIGLVIILAMGIMAVVRRQYGFLIVFGVLCPFSIPLSSIRGVPTLLLFLCICGLALVLERSLANKKQFGGVMEGLPALFLLFVGWVVARYLANPTLPNIAGFGSDVTGFRSYLAYAMSFALAVFLLLIVRSSTEVGAIIRWMGLVSFWLIVFFTPLIFLGGGILVQIAEFLGIFVTRFDNGWLRFVILPGFGIVLICLGLLPSLVPAWYSKRWWLVGIGTLAVVLGGGRGSFLIAMVIVFVIRFLQRRFRDLFIAAVILMLVSLAGNLLADGILERSGNLAFLRIVSLFNPRVAAATDADDNVLWRKVRWERAMEGIADNPVFGNGYGGLKNAFVWGTAQQQEVASVEVDVASGGVHNGYLASAWALGIPAVAIFVAMVSVIIFKTGSASMAQFGKDDTRASLNAFVCANLLGSLVSIYVGADLSNPQIWLFISLGFVATRMTAAARRA